MKVDIFAGGVGATLFARILPLSKFLERCNVECKMVLPIKWHSMAEGKISNILSIVLTHYPNGYADVLKFPPDAVIIGRTSTPQIYLLQKLLKSKGVKIIFDLDDALFLNTGSFCGVNIRPGSFFLEKVIKNADFVTVNGHYLLKYVKAFCKNAAIIHDPIDVELFNPRFKRYCEKVTIGWQGNPKVHYENLRILIKPLMKIAQQYDIKLKISSYLGDPKVKQIFQKLERFVEIDYGLTHWVPITEFAKLLYDLDIIVAPLKETPWYEGKSAAKAGIGMALGIPVVASPVGEQKYIVKHGVTGFIAKKEIEWYYYLKELIEDGRLRSYMGKLGRNVAEKKLSVHACGEKLFSILNKFE